MKNKREKTICFAYFGDNEFLGWYADTFGSIRSSPKLYGDSKEQTDIISKGFRYKLEKARKAEKLRAEEIIEEANPFAGAILSSGLRGDEAILIKYKDIELRIVECPYYDGPNPSYDSEAFKKAYDEHRKKMKEAGIFDIPAPSKERIDAIEEFEKTNPRPESDSWTYADYSKVERWAKNEPTNFIGKITK